MIYLFSIFFIYFINTFFKKKGYLINNTGQSHQEFSSKIYTPLTGGIFLLLFLIFNNFEDWIFLFYFVLLFSIGVITDLDIIKSPSKRIVIQIIYLILFVIYFNLKITDLRVDLLNFLLLNKYFNFFFIVFCFLVLINGSNFIDGNNGISIGYYLIIFIILVLLMSDKTISFDKDLIVNFSIFLSILLIFNLFNFFYLGDNGIYLLSVFTGYILINLINQNYNLSPYFIACLLWYPSFELLFSMIRKFKKKISPMKPDVNHLHQLIFKSLSRKFKFQKKYLNSLTGIVINSYNLIILLLCSLKPESSNHQISLILFNIVFYIMIYFVLKKTNEA